MGGLTKEPKVKIGTENVSSLGYLCAPFLEEHPLALAPDQLIDQLLGFWKWDLGFGSGTLVLEVGLRKFFEITFLYLVGSLVLHERKKTCRRL